jgi:hypothetical protein
MNLLSAIKSAFAPSEPPTLAQLAHGLCVLPMPKARYQAPEKASVADMYVIDEDTKTFGFHSATARKHENGGTPEITGYDVTLLRERDLWGGLKNKVMHGKNAVCKKCWHAGDTEHEAAVKLGRSESWVEKRYGTFSTALLAEVAEREK